MIRAASTSTSAAADAVTARGRPLANPSNASFKIGPGSSGSK